VCGAIFGSGMRSRRFKDSPCNPRCPRWRSSPVSEFHGSRLKGFEPLDLLAESLSIKVLRMPAIRLDPVRAIVRPVPSPVEAIYREHGATVARWVVRLGGPRFDAEDAVQEVFAIVA